MVIEPKHAVLVIFCRRPKPGYGKQRIAAELGQEVALLVAELLLDAALEDASNWPGEVVLAPADHEDVDWAATLLPGATVMAQPEGNLGHRIRQIDARVRARGSQIVLFIGTDAPGLTDQDLVDAIAGLEVSSAVFIPAADGGITLLGATKSWPQLDDLAWETADLHNAIRDRCESVGWQCLDLQTGFDVDTRADLILAGKYLVNDPRPSRQRLCSWIASIDLEPHEITKQLPRAGSVSCVIPVYHDANALGILLNRLTSLEAPPDEILVIDGANDSDCLLLCKERQVHYHRSNACRGAQLDFGAALARSEILWFLHADATPADNSISLIRQHIATGNTGGYFRFRFTGPRSWHRRMLETAINWRARFGIPYGDQGLFMRFDAYREAGGFAAEPLFEEVQLVKRLRRLGAFIALDAPIGVATRRWERDGWLRRSLRNRMLTIRFMLGAPPRKLAESYKPELRSDPND